MDHGNTLRSFSPEREPLFVLDILLLLRVEVLVGLGGVFGDGTQEGPRRAPGCGASPCQYAKPPPSCLQPMGSALAPALLPRTGELLVVTGASRQRFSPILYQHAPLSA